MPEMSEAAVMLLGRYQNLGTPEELTKKQRDLEGDNQKQRDEIRELKEANKKLPKDGERVLTVDEVKEWDALKALGKPVADLSKMGTDLEALQKKDAERTRADAALGAVKAEGWKEESAGVLLQLKDVDGATFETKKVKEKDRSGADVDVERGFITLPGEGQRPQRLSEFVTEKIPAVATLITAAASGTGGDRSRTTGSTTGVTYPPQRNGGGSPLAQNVPEEQVRASHSANARAGL